MARGYLCIVLHAHLPFVRHPEHEDFLEEDWFYEAVTESYLPLLHVFEGLERDGIRFRLTMSLSPTLCAMMQDPLLQRRCRTHLEKLIELSDRERQRTQGQDQFHPLAVMYHRRFAQMLETLNRWNGDLTRAFSWLRERGDLELLACAATHGYLPALKPQPDAVRAQVRVAVREYERVFGLKPGGMWLPECGYYPGLDEILAEEGIRFFFVDAHGLMMGTTPPRYGVYAPVCCPSGVAVFGRDPECTVQVWSSKVGYPGDADYREFYRDIGYDLDLEYVGLYILPDGTRVNTGIKYYRITGETDQKEPYVRDRALQKAQAHAANFMFNRERQLEWHARHMDRKPIVVAPYDAELFGHWWFEGPDWLDFLIRKSNTEQQVFEFITPSEYLRQYPENQVLTPSAGSWGHRGYSEAWVCGKNDWVYRHLHAASVRMARLAAASRTRRDAATRTLVRRALNQAARELLLAQASDWAFIMRSGTMVDYALRRTQEHLVAFTNLYNQIVAGVVNAEYLARLEERNNIFPAMDYRLLAARRARSVIKKGAKSA